MGWQVKLDDGTVVNFGKLPTSFFEAQADVEGIDYWELVNQHPARSLPRWRAFCEATRTHLNISIPPLETMDDFMDFTEERVTATQPISEKPVIDGFPQEPGEPEKGSTSGSPGATDGRPT